MSDKQQQNAATPSGTNGSNNDQKEGKFFLLDVGYLTSYLESLINGEIELIPIINHNSDGTAATIEDEICIQAVSWKYEELSDDNKQVVENTGTNLANGLTTKIAERNFSLSQISDTLKLKKVSHLGEEKKVKDFVEHIYKQNELHKYIGADKGQNDANVSVISEMLRLQSLKEYSGPNDQMLSTNVYQKGTTIIYNEEVLSKETTISIYRVDKFKGNQAGNRIVSDGLASTMLSLAIVCVILGVFAYNYKSLQKLITRVFYKPPRNQDKSVSEDQDNVSQPVTS